MKGREDEDWEVQERQGDLYIWLHGNWNGVSSDCEDDSIETAMKVAREAYDDAQKEQLQRREELLKKCGF